MAVPLQLPPIFMQLQAPLLVLNNVVALAIGPERQALRVSISLPLLVVLVAQSLYREWDVGWGYRYGYEIFVMTMIYQYFDWILVKSPDREGWYKIQYGKGIEQEKDKDKMSNSQMNGNGAGENRRYQLVPGGAGTTFWSRLWWGMRLSITNRYVGWSHQVKNVNMEVPSDYPRLRFIARKALRAVIFYVVCDIVTAHSAASPYGTYDALQRSSKKLYQALPADAPFFTVRFWYTWVHILLTWMSLETMHTCYGIFSVMVGLANPRDCPSGFGRLRDLWSVRQAWSVVWHQQMRRICSAPSLWLARDALRLRKGSFASKYVQLFITFANSAMVHGGGSMLIARSLEDDGAFRFFMAQAAIIFVEDHLIALGKRLGFKDALGWRVLGFLWTVLMIGSTCEDWFRKTIEHGIWIHAATPDLLGIGPKQG